MSYPSELCAIAASYLLTFVSMYDAAGDGPNPRAGRKGLVFGDTLSDRSYSTNLLTNLELIEPDNKMGWKCLVDKDQTLEFLRLRGLSNPEREQVVGEYLMTLCEWEGVPTTRNDFILPSKANDFRGTLIEHGLCEERVGALRWSDYAGPAMRSGRQWDTLDRSVSELENKATREEAERIWTFLSDHTKNMLIRQTDEHSILVIWKLLKDHWDGSQWELRDRIWPPVKFALAEAVFKLIRNKQSANHVSSIN